MHNISDADMLGDADFARWCMLCGKATDETLEGLLPVYQWQRAKEWFCKNGTAEQQAQIMLYLGRAEAEDGDYDKAMEVYTDALLFAKDHEEYNMAGYICTYMADLYDLRDMSDESRRKIKEAAELFLRANNLKSYAYALRNQAAEWAFIDSFHLAMPLLYKADSLSNILRDETLTATMANASGFIYAK